MSQRRYQLQVYARGVTSTTGTVSYTFTSSQFARAPVVGGQVVHPTDARVESSPWNVDLLDLGGTAVSGTLATTAQRMHWIGRLARLRESYNSTASSAYETVAVSRVADLSLNADVATYRVTFQDERWVERQTDIFTRANTCMLVPSGIIAPFHNMRATTPPVWRVAVVSGNLVCVEYRGASNYIPVVQRAVQIIVDDVKPGAVGNATSITTGNFNTLRFRVTGTSTDYEIATFETIYSGPSLRPVAPGNGFVGNWESASEPLPTPFFIWLVWPSSQPSVGTDLTGYVYAPTHPPTFEFPLHVGGSSGIRPGVLWRAIYAGTYSASTGTIVRHSTAAFNVIESEQGYGRVWLRITAPMTMADFVEQHLAAPYHVAPLLDTLGRVAPLSLRIPATTAITPATLLTLGSSNCLDHPTWEHPSQDAVTVLRYQVPSFTPRAIGPLNSAALTALYREAAVDNLLVSTGRLERTHDTVTVLGQQSRSVTFGGAVMRPPIAAAPSSGSGRPTADDLADHLAQNIFPRFGDGPIWSAVQAMDSVDRTTRGRILPGTFVKVAIATQPNPAANARGSTRIMQVMSRDDTPQGPLLRLLDAGPNLSVLTTPSLALARSTANPRHVIIATVSGMTAGSLAQVQCAVTSTGTTAAPASTASNWFAVKASSRGSTGLTFHSGWLPSGTKVWGRARAVAPNRIGSAWSVVDSTVLASITAPTIVAVDNITAGTALFRWTNGSSQYPSRVMVDASTGAVLGSSNTVATVQAGTTRYQFQGLNSNDSHKVGVQHFDAFGGVSGQDTTTFTTTTAYTQLSAPRGLVVVRGA